MTHTLLKAFQLGSAGAALLVVASCGAGVPVISFENTASIGAASRPSVQGQGYALVENRGPSDAFIKVPGRIAQILTVDERMYANGLMQYVSLNADPSVRGENHIEIRLVGKSRFTDLEESLEPHGLGAQSLRSDFSAQFPSQPFSVDPTLHYNQFGTFAFSFFSRPGSLGCVYGWQNVESQTTNERTRFFLAAWSDRRQATNNAQLSYRIRYCAEKFTWADAVDLMKSLRIDVPSDVFNRRRDMRWGNMVDYEGAVLSSDPTENQYSAGAPHFETRNQLCAEPGELPGGYDGMGPLANIPRDNCEPVRAPQPVVRRAPAPAPAPQPAPQQVAAKPSTQPKPQLEQPARPEVDPSNFPAIPLPPTQATPGVVRTAPAPGVQEVVPSIATPTLQPEPMTDPSPRIIDLNPQKPTVRIDPMAISVTEEPMVTQPQAAPAQQATTVQAIAQEAEKTAESTVQFAIPMPQ